MCSNPPQGCRAPQPYHSAASQWPTISVLTLTPLALGRTAGIGRCSSLTRQVFYKQAHSQCNEVVYWYFISNYYAANKIINY